MNLTESTRTIHYASQSTSRASAIILDYVLRSCPLERRPQIIERPQEEGNPLYSLDESLTQESIDDLVERTVDRLLEVDSPSLETIKMQVAFDSSYITEEEDLVNFYQRRNVRLRELQRTITTMRPKCGADFDALTALHRQVRVLQAFSYLWENHTLHPSGRTLSRGREKRAAQ